MTYDINPWHYPNTRFIPDAAIMVLKPPLKVGMLTIMHAFCTIMDAFCIFILQL